MVRSLNTPKTRTAINLKKYILRKLSSGKKKGQVELKLGSPKTISSLMFTNTYESVIKNKNWFSEKKHRSWKDGGEGEGRVRGKGEKEERKDVHASRKLMDKETLFFSFWAK